MQRGAARKRVQKLLDGQDGFVFAVDDHQAAGITLVKAEPQRDVVQVSCKRALEQRRAHCAQALTAVKVQNACGHNPLFRLKDGAKQLVFVHRLEQIVHNAVADGVVRIVKIRMGGQQNEFASKALLPCCADQFDAAQARHADVQKDDVRVESLYFCQSLLSICRDANHLKAVLPPVYNALQSQDHIALIIDKHQFHGFSSDLSKGRIRSMTVPTPSSL